jgi:hypothetical protein
MKIIFTLTLSVFVFTFSSTSLFAQSYKSLIVNEIIASNSNTISDSSGNYEDWIEIYNPQANSQSLVDYYITDDISNPTKHKLSGNASELTIAANGYLIIWASGNPNRGATHTNFGLSASGEVVFLFAPNGTTLIDSISFGNQKTDISYGRISDGAANWAYFTSPTPGASNASATPYIGFLDPPIFSQTSGFYNANFNLSITANPSDAIIYYSIDGSIPEPNLVGGLVYNFKNQFPQTPSDPVGAILSDTIRAFVYSNPLPISNASTKANRLAAKTTSTDAAFPPAYMPTTTIRKATVVKARAYKTGFIPSEVVTATYFVNANGLNPYNLPVISLATQENNLFDYNNGVYTAGKDFDDWRAANPTENITSGRPANWQRSSEFPMSVEIFESGATTRTHYVNAGFRIHGGFSSARPRKSFRLYFKNEYGASDLNYPIFPSQSETAFKRIIIRNSGQDENSSNLRDLAMQKMVSHMRFDVMDGQPSILFVNGEFWGVNNIRERFDAKYFQRKHGIPEDKIDILEFDSEVVEGHFAHYVSMMIYAANNDITQQNVLDSVNRMMDIDNFIDYYVAQIFLANTDWPGNNVKYYRMQTPHYMPNAPYAQDGRWRWMMYDTDFGFGLFDNVNHNTLAMALDPNSTVWPNPQWSTALFRRLILNDSFKQQFITRYADMLNTAFLPSVTDSILQHYKNLIAPYMPEHFDRWVNRPGMTQWNTILNNMSSYCTNRPIRAKQHLMSQFTLNQMHSVTVNVSHANRGYVQINTIDIVENTHGVSPNPYPWTGEYFQGVPVKLIAKAKPGYQFVQWFGDVNSTNPEITVNLTANTNLIAIFEGCDFDNIHYWHFNDLATGNVDDIAPDSSLLSGAMVSYVGTGAGYMDRTNTTEGSSLNALYGNAAERALRVRNPSNTRSLIIKAPTTGYANLTLNFASMRTNNGAQNQSLYYAENDTATWKLIAGDYSITENFELYRFAINAAEAANNPNLLLKIDFGGSNNSASSGNNRFDNISISGVAATFTNTTAEICMGDYYVFGADTLRHAGKYLRSTSCTDKHSLQLMVDSIDISVSTSDYTLTANENNATYKWLDCNNAFSPIAGATSKSFTPTANGNYAVEISRANCTAVSSCYTVNNVSAIAETKIKSVKLYPNPAQEKAWLQFENHDFNELRVEIYSINGQQVFGKNYNSTQTIELNLSQFPSGFYLVKMQAENMNEVLRLIK